MPHACTRQFSIHRPHLQFRCPIHVDDVVSIILSLLSDHHGQGTCSDGAAAPGLLMNMGGPDSLNRLQMGEIVCKCVLDPLINKFFPASELFFAISLLTALLRFFWVLESSLRIFSKEAANVTDCQCRNE